MPKPTYCPNPACPNHGCPRGQWYHHFGAYTTVAHGIVPRYRCIHCGKTMGDQTESIHYFAKRRLPLRAIWKTLAGGACLREVAWRYHTTPHTIQTAVLRLGRQAIAAQCHLLDELEPRSQVCFDGLRSYVTAQDYPCDITTVVDRAGETILTMTHAITRRGGTMTEAQKKRYKKKLRIWAPAGGTVSREIEATIDAIWDYLRPTLARPAIIDTDEHPIYRDQLRRDPVFGHFRRLRLIRHRRTSSRAPRTGYNPLFPVNYVDRLLRHRVKEHTRESIAFGRHASLQMHRAWLFAWEHNARRPWRVKVPEVGCHAEVDGTKIDPPLGPAVEPGVVARIGRQLFTRRIRLRGVAVPTSMARAWMLGLPTPPHRWKKGQQPVTIRLPHFAIRDLLQGELAPDFQQAA